MVVDAVVTWVDGADVEHIQKRQTYLKSWQEKIPEDSAAPTRFNSSGEINYCLRSLLHFAPWIRTIYVVTDGQTPLFVTTLQGTSYANRIQMIDHREIFNSFEEYLPTFNSLSIESMLWRIPGLSEHFIYLNDDCALLRPAQKKDFFSDDCPVVRGEWKTQYAHKWHYILKQGLTQIFPDFFSLQPMAPHRKYQENSARLAGYTHKFLHLSHVPFPLTRQMFIDCFENYREIFLHNLNYPVRSPEQFWSISWVYHVGMREKKVVINNTLKAVSVHVTHHPWPKIITRLSRARRDPKVAFVCIQSLDQGTSEQQKTLLAWLDACIPNMT